MRQKLLGRFGERMADAYLRRHQYQILAANFQTRAGEIDLIARDPDGQLVFFEIKTREGDDHGLGEEAIQESKTRKMRCAALAYLSSHGSEEDAENYRFDALVLTLNSFQKNMAIRHCKAIGSS